MNIVKELSKLLISELSNEFVTISTTVNGVKYQVSIGLEMNYTILFRSDFTNKGVIEVTSPVSGLYKSVYIYYNVKENKYILNNGSNEILKNRCDRMCYEKLLEIIEIINKLL